MKYLFTALMLLSTHYALAQTQPDSRLKSAAYIQASVNKDIGFFYFSETSSQNAFSNTDGIVSPGGGVGIALEGGYRLSSLIHLGIQTNGQLALAGSSYSSTSGANSSSWISISRLSVTPRIDFTIINIDDFFLNTIQLGGGPMFNTYGALVIKNDEQTDKINYKNNWGWTTQLNLIMDLFNNEDVIIIGSVGYRHTRIEAKDKENMPYKFREVNGSGLNFQLGIRKYLK